MTPTVKSLPALGLAAELEPAEVDPAGAAEADPAGAAAEDEPAVVAAEDEPAGAAAELLDGLELVDVLGELEHEATSGITAAAVTAARAHLRWNSFTCFLLWVGRTLRARVGSGSEM